MNTKKIVIALLIAVVTVIGVSAQVVDPGNPMICLNPGSTMYPQTPVASDPYIDPKTFDITTALSGYNLIVVVPIEYRDPVKMQNYKRLLVENSGVFQAVIMDARKKMSVIDVVPRITKVSGEGGSLYLCINVVLPSNYTKFCFWFDARFEPIINDGVLTPMTKNLIGFVGYNKDQFKQPAANAAPVAQTPRQPVFTPVGGGVTPGAAETPSLAPVTGGLR